MLQQILCSQGFDAEWRTGVAEECCGFFDGQLWPSHSWAVCNGLILDITADQFAAPPVIIVPDGDRRYRGSALDPAGPEWQARRRQAADEAFTLWRQQMPV